MEYFAELGHLGLLLSSFLAATVLPLSSEVVLAALLHAGLAPAGLVAVATFGNVAGAVVNYALGYWGADFLGRKISAGSGARLGAARTRYRKLGHASLLLAWVPIIGDPITVVAGVLGTDLRLFLFLVTAGKLARYVVIAWVVA
jgi:membrane protein YqaA with SNARE-associated domain